MKISTHTTLASTRRCLEPKRPCSSVPGETETEHPLRGFTFLVDSFVPSTTRYAVYHLSDTVMISEVWLHESNLTSPEYQADLPNFVERSDAVIWNVMVAIASLANKQKLRSESKLIARRWNTALMAAPF